MQNFSYVSAMSVQTFVEMCSVDSEINADKNGLEIYYYRLNKLLYFWPTFTNNARNIKIGQIVVVDKTMVVITYYYYMIYRLRMIGYH